MQTLRAYIGILICTGAFFRVLHAQPSTIPDTNVWMPNGPVFATEATADMLFIGGAFDQVGPLTGGFAEVSAATGEVATSYRRLNGSFLTSISDGSGGVFVAGLFTYFGETPTTNVVHLTAGHQLVGPSVACNGAVRALVKSGNTLFLGGDFTSVNGEPRSFLAAIDSVTGALLPFDAATDGPVYTLALSDDRLYLGGNFQRVRTEQRRFLAAIDVTTGEVSSWNPNPDGSGVWQVEYRDGRLYVLGDFSQISGVDRVWLAAFAVADFSILPWHPVPGAPYSIVLVTRIAVASDVIYLCGGFQSLSGQFRSKIGAVDPDKGLPTSWDPQILVNTPFTMALSADTLYVGGSFTGVGTNGPRRLAAIELSTGLPRQWVPAPSSTVTTLHVEGETVYVGGDFVSIGGVYRELLAAIDLTSGRALPWDAKIGAQAIGGDAMYSLKLRDGILYSAGRYYSVGGQRRNGISAVKVSDGSVLPFTPSFSGAPFIPDIQIVDDYLVASGIPFGGPVIINISGGGTLGEGFQTDGEVVAFAAKGSVLYFGGQFNVVRGQPRANLAAFDFRTYTLLPWNPEVDGRVTALFVGDQTVFAAGDFLNANHAPHARLAAFDSVTGKTALGLDRFFVDGPIYRLSGTSSLLFVGGEFSQINGLPAPFFGGVDLLSGDVRWALPQVTPDPQMRAWDIRWTSKDLFVTAPFVNLNEHAAWGFGAYLTTNDPPSVQIATPTNGINLRVPENQNLPIEVDATSSVGIREVRVYANTNLLFTSLVSHFVTNWTLPKFIGDYLLTAVAFDTFGNSAVSQAVRATLLPPEDYIAPTLSLLEPVDGSVYSHQSNIFVQVSIDAPKSRIERFETLLGTEVVSVATNAPFFTILSNLPPAKYSLSVRMRDEFGVVAEAGPRAFRINAPPQTTLVQPRDGLITFSGTDLLLRAIPSDPDGTIAKQTLFLGESPLAVLGPSEQFFFWKNIPSGNFVLRAVATDDFGESSTSATVKVTVLESPKLDFILDDTDTNVTLIGNWNVGKSNRAYRGNFSFAYSSTNTTETAFYRPFVPTNDFYDVSVSYPQGADRATNSQWVITYDGGTTNLAVDETMKGGSWLLLAASLPFKSGSNTVVSVSTLTGEGTNKIVVVDAVRFTTSVGPVITNQPQGLIANSGTNVSLKVASSGSAPLTYQWYKGSVAIEGAQSNLLTIVNIRPEDSGTYFVSISNAKGTTRSAEATVEVVGPIEFTNMRIDKSNMFVAEIQGARDDRLSVESSVDLINWSFYANPKITNEVLFIYYPMADERLRFFRVRDTLTNSPALLSGRR